MSCHVMSGIFSFCSYILIAVAMLAIALASGVTVAERKFFKKYPVIVNQTVPTN